MHFAISNVLCRHIKSRIRAFEWKYLHSTLAHSKGQSQGHEHLVNGNRLGNLTVAIKKLQTFAIE